MFVFYYRVERLIPRARSFHSTGSARVLRIFTDYDLSFFFFFLLMEIYELLAIIYFYDRAVILLFAKQNTINGISKRNPDLPSRREKIVAATARRGR